MLSSWPAERFLLVTCLAVPRQEGIVGSHRRLTYSELRVLVEGFEIISSDGLATRGVARRVTAELDRCSGDE